MGFSFLFGGEQVFTWGWAFGPAAVSFAAGSAPSSREEVAFSESSVPHPHTSFPFYTGLAGSGLLGWGRSPPCWLLGLGLA